MPTIPLKDYIYAAVIALLLIGFGLFVHHERGIGEAKVLAADAKVVAIQKAHDTDVQNAATAATSEAIKSYVKTIAKPVTGTAPIRVLNGALCRSPVPAAASGNGAVAGAGSGADVSAADRDAGQALSDGLVTVGRDADAEVIALQTEVAALRKEMIQSNGVSK